MMDTDYSEAREKILLATLPHVAFDGWVERTLKLGAEDAGYDPEMASRAFPGGATDMIRFWSDYGDREMLRQMGEIGPAKLRFRERLVTAVRLRIDVNAPYRESVRRTMSYLAMPQHTALAARSTLNTVSALWYAVGDSATDFSYYTKRAMLTPIYVATVLYWLDDTSEGSIDTWSFLERRIDNAMVLPRMQDRVRSALTMVKSPFGMRPRFSQRPQPPDRTF